MEAWSILVNNENIALKVFNAFLVENLTYSNVNPFLMLEKYTAQGLLRKQFLILVALSRHITRKGYFSSFKHD